MRPSSRGPFSAIGWYLLPGPAYCGCFGYAAYFSGVFVYAYSGRSPLGMAASTLGRLHSIFSHGIPQISLKC